MDQLRRLTMYGAAAYSIVVQGALPSDLSEYMGGIEIDTCEQDDGEVTTLCGEFIDQAELIGTINHLDRSRLQILSLHCESVA